MRIPLVIATVSASLLLTACGGVNESPGTAPPRPVAGPPEDPCTLLTPAEVAAVVNVDPAAVPPKTNPGSSQCEWKATGQLAALTLEVTFVSPEDAGEDQLAETLALHRSSWGGVTVEGFTDAANWYSEGAIRTFFATRGRYVIRLSGMGSTFDPDSTKNRDRFATAATTVLDRLGGAK